MRKIRIRLGTVTVDAELAHTPTADLIGNILPFEGSFHTWGDEIYFSIPVHAELDATAREVVELGDLGYWPPGNAFCIFFGPTPMSRGDEIRPAGPVNIVGRLTGDPAKVKSAMGEARIRIEPL